MHSMKQLHFQLPAKHALTSKESTYTLVHTGGTSAFS